MYQSGGFQAKMRQLLIGAEQGAVSAEYAIMAVLIGVAVVATVTVIGLKVKELIGGVLRAF